MSTHLADSEIYGHLWTTPELHEQLDDTGRTRAWLAILAALAAAQAEVGLVPPEAAEDIAAHARVSELDLAEIGAGTRRSGHSTHGLIAALRTVLPARAREWVYYGATVQDVSDTWFAMVVRATGDVVARDVARVRDAAVSLARRHRDTVMCGRTHAQPGLPVTFGFKAAVWADELDRHLERLAQARPRLEVVQLGGALGTGEFFGDAYLPLLDAFARRLGLGVPDLPWITARDRVAEFVGLLAMVTGTLAKIGNEIVELQRPEIGEVGEPVVAGTVGSITMPHKRNPELSEHLDTLARLVRADAAVALEGLVALHERDGRGWKAEWIALPEACQLTGVALRFAATLLEGLTVDAARMRANLDSHGGAMTSEPLMAAVAAKLGKHTAHDAVYAAAMAARDAGEDLGDRLVAEGLLDAAEVASARDPHRALGAATAFVDRIVARHPP
ncbi:3-sulfopropionylcysteine synthase XcbD [Actinomycetospora sp. C-140]